MKLEDRQNRQKSRELTKLKRKSQTCHCYTLKIDESHLNQNQKLFLNRIFLEAKWFYNFVLSKENIFDTSVRKVNQVQVKRLEGFEDRSSNKEKNKSQYSH